MRKVIVAAAVAAMCSAAAGAPVTVTSCDTPSQDPLILYYMAEELGTGFPADELISASWQATSYRPCLQNPDDPNIANVEVTIVNLTKRTFYELVYVADPETSLSNDDGTVNCELAFNIDNLGLNTPLVYEDNPNLAFEPNETWKFVIQDYTNSLGLAPSLFGSYSAGPPVAGLVGSQSGGDTVSSGSIIPEPATVTLLVVGALAAMRRRKR